MCVAAAWRLADSEWSTGYVRARGGEGLESAAVANPLLAPPSSPRPPSGAEALAREALRRGSLDNVCVMVVSLAPAPLPPPVQPGPPPVALEPARPQPSEAPRR